MANPNQPFGAFGGFGAPSGVGEAPKPGMPFSFGAPAQASTAAGSTAPSFGFGQPSKAGPAQPVATAAAPAFGALGGLLNAGPSSQPFGQGLAKPATTTPTAFSLGVATCAPSLTTGAATSSVSSFGFGAPGGAFSFGAAAPSAAGAGGISASGSGSAATSVFGLGNTTAAAAAPGGFSFGASAAAPSIGFGTTPATTAVSLGAAATSTAPAMAAGIPAPATASSASLFGFNAPAASSLGFKPAGTGSSSFGLGAPATAAPAFGTAAPAATAAPTTGGGALTFGFGSSALAGSGASAGVAPVFGHTAATTTAVAPTPSLASILSSTPAPSFSMATGLTSTSGPTFSLGAGVTSAPPSSFTSSSGTITTSATTVTTAATPSFGLGSSLTAATPSFGLGSSQLSLSTASSTPFGLVSGMPPTTSGATQQSGLKLGGSVSAPAAGGSMGLGGLAGISSKPEVSASTSASLLTAKSLAPATTTTVAHNLPVQESGGAPTTVTSTAASTPASTGLQLSLPTAATGTTGPAGSTVGSAVQQESQATAAQAASMTYKDLEECINKWSHEFEEQERIFLQQATQINAWDRLLVENGEKITELNADVDSVKIDQQRLSSELDFIVSQQKELEEMLIPLEKAFEQMPTPGSMAAAAAGSHLRHADVERERTYQMAVNIDAQLKRLVEEMREVVDHLNAPSVEASKDSDPMQQITKILGAHMDSLQWIDRSMETLQKKVDDAGKLSEQLRRDQERSFRLAYS